MKSTRRSAAQHHPAGEAVILFSVGEQTFAIAAAAVDEIRNSDGLTAAETNAPPCVTHTLSRRRIKFAVLDAARYFKMPPARHQRVLVLRQAHVAVLVGAIDRMAEFDSVLPLPSAFQGEERAWYRGLAIANGRVVPVVNPLGFVQAAGNAKQVEVLAGAATA